MKLDGNAVKRYRSKRTVDAAKITNVALDGDDYFISVEDMRIPLVLGKDWVRICQPKIGGYILIYSGGEVAYMTPERFANEFELITNPEKNGE